MKATGIVRRIDDLGRVVIPKEIRRTMRIREGDPLEIYTGSGGEVVFRKYSPIVELAGISSQYAEAAATVSHIADIPNSTPTSNRFRPSHKVAAKNRRLAIHCSKSAPLCRTLPRRRRQ